VIDVMTTDGLTIAEQAVPGLLEPFLLDEAGSAAHALGSRT
jgi:hypothetical protein